MPRNLKWGYTYSVALHVLVAVAMFAWALIEVLFPEEVVDNKTVFNLVEPQPEQLQNSQQDDEKTDEDINVDKVEKIDPLVDIPATPPEPIEKKIDKPTEKPVEKKIDKPTEKPIEKPKVVDIEQWRKKNKISPTNKRRSKKRNQIKVDKIAIEKSSLDSISISTDTSTSSEMQDILSSYVTQIHNIVHANWKIPTVDRDEISVRVSFNVSRSGAISNIRIVRSSGNKDYDDSTIRALKSVRIPAPPDRKEHTITINFEA